MSRRLARYAQLVRVCRTRGCSRDDALDMAQEAYLRLLEYQRIAEVPDPDSILRRIVINLSINYYHREQWMACAFESIDEADRRGMLIGLDPGPERTLAAEQELVHVARLLSSVSSRTSQIFIAQRGGYSYAEIAAAFAVKPRTVEKHVTNAALTLTQSLKVRPIDRRGFPPGGSRLPSARFKREYAGTARPQAGTSPFRTSTSAEHAALNPVVIRGDQPRAAFGRKERSSRKFSSDLL